MTPAEFILQIEEECIVKLEIVGGIPTWEPFPGLQHQRAIDRIRAFIRPASKEENACIHVYDVSILFPDGSLKRPDIAIFCREPAEQTGAVTMLPEAVIEIISPTYEAKDLTIGVPFYLRSGLKDVIVFDPETGDVRHFRPGYSEERHQTPVTLALACGCEVTV